MPQDAPTHDPLVAEVARCIDGHDLFARGAHVLVGVSGGADSVALLHVLRRLAAQGRGYRLTAAHLDHALRAESPGDAEFVRDLARRWDLPCVVERRDVGAIARREGVSAETAARQVRYAFLSDAARRVGAEAVAVAHHADDNVETVLQRIVRGTHLGGLAGMPVKRRLGRGDGGAVLLVRPLLRCRRGEIEAYCRRSGLTWRTDATNADTAYRRNFIRHELLPQLRRRLNPQADAAILRLADAADEARRLLDQLAESALADAGCRIVSGRAALDAAALAAQPPLLRRCALRSVLERLDAPMRGVDSAHLAELAELAGRPPPTAVDLPGALRARREDDRLIIEAPDTWLPWPDEIELRCPGRTALPDGREIVCRRLPLDRGRFEAHVACPQDGVEWLDADEVHGRLLCRRRREADAFVPLGAPGRQSVSDFLTNRKLPRRFREQVVCVLDADGLIYLAPCRIADRVKITHQTRRVLRIELG